jgi:hypothetical protein
LSELNAFVEFFLPDGLIDCHEQRLRV